MFKKCLLFIAMSIMCPSLLCGAATYTISAVSMPNGSSATEIYGASTYGAVGISVMGDFSQGAGVSVPTLWVGGQSAILPTGEVSQGYAYGINSNGDAVGSTSPIGSELPKPAFWHEGQLQTLSTLNMSSGGAQAINNSGEIVGEIISNTSGSFQTEAVLWSHGQASVLGNFPNMQAWATSINNVGQVVINASGVIGNVSTN